MPPNDDMTSPQEEAFDLYREVQNILFDVMDLTVGQEKELREKFIDFGRRAANDALERAAKACECDWPKGMPAQAIEYRAAEILAGRIRALKREGR